MRAGAETHVEMSEDTGFRGGEVEVGKEKADMGRRADPCSECAHGYCRGSVGLNRLDGVHWGNMGSTDRESLCCQLA